ncbi:hypothetical protein HAX54_005283 [Datura stramonium]|uniref:Uncharacterized protein n=1 Tax=Datura stramonium TaxID=4076 RepID=A0ABS8RU47_DATST|nr:hypothetical protein [Datura stramonium]
MGMLVNLGAILKSTMIKERVEKGFRFSFGGLITHFLREKQIDEELRLSGVTDDQLQQLNADYLLNEHVMAFCKVEAEYKEPMDDDIPIDDDQARNDSDLEFDDVDGEDSEMGDSTYAPTDNEQE